MTPNMSESPAVDKEKTTSYSTFHAGFVKFKIFMKPSRRQHGTLDRSREAPAGDCLRPPVGKIF
jgi:hypothetical protein